jgi:hypothetical protein
VRRIAANIAKLTNLLTMPLRTPRGERGRWNVAVMAAEVVSEVAVGLRAPLMVSEAVVREAAGTAAARDP